MVFYYVYKTGKLTFILINDIILVFFTKLHSMQQPKRIFIADSFHTVKIAEQLQSFYGPEVEIYCEPGHFSNRNNDQLGAVLAAVLEKPTIATVTNPGEKKDFDAFFLSGRLILEGDVDPITLKKEFGKPGSKVVVVSTLQEYLDEIKQKNLGADFYIRKQHIGPAASMSTEIKNQLISFLQ